MAAANPNLLGAGSIGRVEKVAFNGEFAARKLFGEVEYFNHEKNIFQGLQRFPHNKIVKVMGVGDNFHDLEFVSGGTLGDAMRIQQRYSTFTTDDVKTILVGCLEALSHLHRALE